MSGDHQEEEPGSRMWAEPEPGPSRCEPSGRGYCGYCHALYSSLEQHLSSPTHLESVRAASRGSAPPRLTLLERFLQDVAEHHPHRYGDARPSHSDLPSVSAPLRPRAELHDASEPGAHRQAEGGGAQTQTPPPIHRKVHRKTNRRKPSESSASSPRERPHTRPRTPAEPRRRAQQRRASSPLGDPVGRTIEEVIQVFCHPPRDETQSLHLSLPVSLETQSDDWDVPLQVLVQTAPPVQVSQRGGRGLSGLTDVQVELEDRAYSSRLDSALLGGGAGPVLPLPERFPESFRGKSWAQIELEDEERVESLVRQFRRGRFVCYFDTESLARCGRSSRRRKVLPESAARGTGVLPLVEAEEEESVRRRGRGRGFRLASRCQVVKVSHGTQTLRLVVPTVHGPSLEAPPTGLPTANERTPETQPWRGLPASYRGVVTPVQPRTSLLYLLCSPSTSGPAPPGGSAPRRCRRRRRPVDLQHLKVKYKRLPVKFYEPGTNRILRNTPQRLLRPRGPAPSGPPPPCVRQLFRSLSPDLNMDRRPGAGPKGDSGDSGTEVVRRRGQASQATPRRTTNRTQRDRGGRPRPPPVQRRTRTPDPPPSSRREGLRRAASSRKPLQPPRRGRGQRGRGYERGGR